MYARTSDVSSGLSQAVAGYSNLLPVPVRQLSPVVVPLPTPVLTPGCRQDASLAKIDSNSMTQSGTGLLIEHGRARVEIFLNDFSTTNSCPRETIEKVMKLYTDNPQIRGAGNYIDVYA